MSGFKALWVKQKRKHFCFAEGFNSAFIVWSCPASAIASIDHWPVAANTLYLTAGQMPIPL